MHSLPDPYRPKPSPPNFPTHNGRLRPRGPHPLLPPLRHLPPLLRQSPLRLHLRPRARRFPFPTHHILPHVARPLRLIPNFLFLPSRSFSPHTHIRRYDSRAIIEYTNISEKCKRAGVLFVAACFDEFCGGGVADGYGGGVCVEFVGDLLVYV